MHLDFDEPIALTGFTSAAFHIEAVAAWLVPAHPRLRQVRKEIANEGEQSGVGGRIGAGRAPNGRLVDVDDLIQRLNPFSSLHPSIFGFF